MPIVNKTVLCTAKNFILSALTTYAHKKRDVRKTVGGVGYAYYLDYGNGTTGICICPNHSDCTH